MMECEIRTNLCTDLIQGMFREPYKAKRWDVKWRHDCSEGGCWLGRFQLNPFFTNHFSLIKKELLGKRFVVKSDHDVGCG